MEEKGKRFTEATWEIKKKKKRFPHSAVPEVGIYLKNIHSYIAQSYTLLEKEKIQSLLFFLFLN